MWQLLWIRAVLSNHYIMSLIANYYNLFKYVLSMMGVSKESISKFLIGNRFHVKLRILSPYSNDSI